MRQVTFLFCALLTIFYVQAYKSYLGYQVWQTETLTHDTLNKLMNFLTNSDDRFEVWSEPIVGRETLIMTSQEHVPELRHQLINIGLESNLVFNDVQRLIDRERDELIETRGLGRSKHENGNVTFDAYMDLDEIESYLDNVVQTYPEMASLEVIGHSLEGRAMRVLRISKNDNRIRPAVFMDAGIHAREWLAPPVALYVLQQLTTVETSMLDLADWYILPVANPDGFVYTWNEDRFWRKNRRHIMNTGCYGVDLNRNFDIKWEEGKKLDPCSTWYKGTSPKSEPETKAIAEFLQTKLKGRLSLYMALHSYSSLLLYPYGHNNNSVSNFVSYAAEKTIEALERVRGTKYKAGSLANLLYIAHGSSQDFAYEVVGARFAYTWELPAGGDRGFNPPASEILPVVQETWEGIKTLANFAIRPPIL